MKLERTTWLLFVAFLVVTAIYWPGLSGPFLFDDVTNLEIVQRWLDGETSWLGAVAGSRNWLIARPVSMATFTFTAWLGDGNSFSYKLGNLALHLACAWVAWSLLTRILPKDASLLNARIAAFAAVLLWLLHPLHVSTVLYAVQRMAQLSAFFALASVLTYVLCRQALEATHVRRAVAGLFVLFPLLLVAGLFSKQNAAIAPGLCLVIELAYFWKRGQQHLAVIAFFAVFLLLPAVAVLGILAVSPDRLLAGYAEWDFTLQQRLMSEPRALMDYIAMLLVPQGPRMGLYTDDFATSIGLMTPPTTLLSITVLTAISITTIAYRKRVPSIFAGWFFFLVAHGVESSFIPVELYYEHRNYLPAIGLFVAVVATINQLLSFLSLRGGYDGRRTASFALLAVSLVLCFATFGRVQIWQSMDSITLQAVNGRPQSIRAAQARSMLLATRGQLDEGIAALQPFLADDSPRSRLLAGIDTLTIRCVRDGSVDLADIDRVVSDAQPKITVGEVLAMRQMQVITSKFGCGELKNDVLADRMVMLIDAAKAQPNNATPKAQMHSLAAVGYARGEQLDKARQHARIAWEATHDLVVGDLLARFYLLSNMPAEARIVIAQLDARVRLEDELGQKNLATLYSMLESASYREQN